MKRILVVDDEPDILDLVALNLELENYKVTTAINGLDALKILKNEMFDLIILDVMMPIINGISVCENLRLENNQTPILFLSAKGTAKEKVEGLKKGADDYMAKPFDLEELLLRVKNLLARTQSEIIVPEIKTLVFGKNSIDFESRRAVGLDGKEFYLTQMEGKFLKLLYENEGQFVSRQKILHIVWGYNVFPSSRSIDNFIVHFRKSFEEDPKNPKHFISLRSVGYKFER